MPSPPPRFAFLRGKRARAALAVALGFALTDLVCLATLAPAYGRLVLFGSIVVAFAAVGVALLRRAGLRFPTLFVFLGAGALYAAYLSATSFDERNYDALAHLQYIHRIADQLELPKAKDCTICHHPPLYHLLAAGVTVGADRTQLVSANFALQVLALGLFFTFLGFGTLTVSRLTSNPRVQPWAAAFLAFWPVSVVNSIRINNDLLLYALVAAGLYYIVRWRRENARAPLIVACAIAAAAALTKLNGIVLTAVIGGLCAWDIARSPTSRSHARRDVPVVAVLLLALVALGGIRAWREQGALSYRALGAAAADDKGIAKRSVITYLWFDPVGYWQEPFSIAIHSQAPDTPYWNHWLKSSLFGTRNQFQWGDGETFVSYRGLARAEGLALLALIAYGVYAAAMVRRFPRDYRGLSVYFAAWFILAALLFHFWAPKPHHTDFRFVYPVLVPLAALFFEAIEAVRRRRALAGLVGYALLIAFWAISIVYFAAGLRPSPTHLVERMLPGPKSEEPRPNALRRFHFGQPSPSRTPTIHR